MTQYGKNVLYRNNGNGTFTDVTAKRAEIVEITWPSGQRQSFRDADKFYLVEEGNDQLQTQHISGRHP